MSILASVGSPAFYPGEQPGYLRAASGAFLQQRAPIAAAVAAPAAPLLVRPSGAVDQCPVVTERNLSTLAFQFSQVSIAPHASIRRWEYRVPAGRMAWLQSGFVMIQTVVTGIVGASAICQLNVYPAHFGAATLLALVKWTGDANGTFVEANLGAPVLLAEGDLVEGLTGDPDTAAGARRTFVVSASIREFNSTNG